MDTPCVDQSQKDLIEACEPLIRFLAENYHPHVTAIVTSTGVELVEGLRSHSTHKTNRKTPL